MQLPDLQGISETRQENPWSKGIWLVIELAWPTSGKIVPISRKEGWDSSGDLEWDEAMCDASSAFRWVFDEGLHAQPRCSGVWVEASFQFWGACWSSPKEGRRTLFPSIQRKGGWAWAMLLAVLSSLLSWKLWDQFGMASRSKKATRWASSWTRSEVLIWPSGLLLLWVHFSPLWSWSLHEASKLWEGDKHPHRSARNQTCCWRKSKAEKGSESVVAAVLTELRFYGRAWTVRTNIDHATFWHYTSEISYNWIFNYKTSIFLRYVINWSTKRYSRTNFCLFDSTEKK